MKKAKKILRRVWISYDAPLAKAKEWTRSGDEDLQREAVKLLKKLWRRYPHGGEIGQELVLALIERNRLEQAEQVLKELALSEKSGREEILCRWGRIFKDRADTHVSLEDPSADTDPIKAVQLYRVALAKYEDAYQVRRGHYPGINVASLHLAIYAVAPEDLRSDADRQGSEDRARDLLERKYSWPHELEDDDVWHLATQADCHLLLGQWSEAAELYEAAQKNPKCRPRSVASMRKNAQRTVQCFRRVGVDDVGPFNKLDKVFPPVPS